MTSFSIRDPVHGTISLDELEHDLINTPEFRRLKRIRQLSFAQYEYPSANHTRFEHSIGTLHMTKKIIASLKENTKNRSDIEDLARHERHITVAALLHDIGHSAFSHSMEQILSENPAWTKTPLDHEKNGHEIITGNTEINRTLKRHSLSETDIKIIAAIATEDLKTLENTQYYMTDIITGDLGSDRIDYLTRDSYHAGLPYIIETSQIISSLTIARIGPDKRICLIYDDERKALSSATYLLISRQHYFEAIVHKPKIRCANVMLKKALELHMETVEDKEKEIRHTFTIYDDSDLIHRMENSENPKIKTLTTLIRSELPLKEKTYFRLDDHAPQLIFMLNAIDRDPEAKSYLRNKTEQELKNKHNLTKDDLIIFDIDINGKSGIPANLYLDADGSRSYLAFDKSPLAEDLALFLPKIGSIALYSEKRIPFTQKDYAKNIVEAFSQIRKKKLIPAEALLIAIAKSTEKERTGLSRFISYAKALFESNQLTPYRDFTPITDRFSYSPSLYKDLILLASCGLISISRIPRAITCESTTIDPTLENIDSITSMVSRYDFALTDIGRTHIENSIKKDPTSHNDYKTLLK